MLKAEILTQAMELYLVGIEVEAEREQLRVAAETYGLSHEKTIEQLNRFQRACDKFTALEQAHIKSTEELAGIASGARNNTPVQN